jgi:hypothetical protein
MPKPYYQSDGIVLYNCDWRDLGYGYYIASDNC